MIFSLAGVQHLKYVIRFVGTFFTATKTSFCSVYCEALFSKEGWVCSYQSADISLVIEPIELSSAFPPAFVSLRFSAGLILNLISLHGIKLRPDVKVRKVFKTCWLERLSISANEDASTDVIFRHLMHCCAFPVGCNTGYYRKGEFTL